MPAVHGSTPFYYILSEFETRDSEGDTSHLHIQSLTIVRKAAVVLPKANVFRESSLQVCEGCLFQRQSWKVS